MIRCSFCDAEILDPYYKNKGEIKTRKFCNKECYENNMREFGRPALKKDFGLKDCEFCKAPFKILGAKYLIRRFCSVSCRARWQASLPYDEWRGKIGAKNKINSSGSRNPMYGKSPSHGKWQNYEDRKGRNFRLRSRWELAVAKYLDFAELNWEYEPKRFNLRSSTYCPDFYIHETNSFWEVKGWYHERARSKVEGFRAKFPETPLVLITKNCIKGMASSVNQDIGLN